MPPHTSGHRRGVAAAPHHAAAEAGRLILAEGGNALEAMVAMAASIAAVYPHMNHVGGDGFWLIREPNGRVRALMAPGPAGAKATVALYRERGYDTIPARGPLAALTVPGAIGGWMLALEAAKALGGKMPLDLLLAPAIKQARDGYAVSRSQHALTRDKLSEMGEAIGFAETFLADGKVPDAGATMKQAAFAGTLDHLASAGLEDFYRGDVGREIAADLERIGSPVTRADLEKYRAYVAEPLSVQLNAGTLYNAPPPTQGLASLIILALFERLRVAEAESFDFVHGLVESTKRAFRVRDRVVTDPNRIKEPLDRYLSAPFLDAEAQTIDRKRAARWPAPYGEGDTIWMGAADASGLVVSYIQSIYWEFGSGCVLPRTGVLMQNRGASFSLDPAALNPLEPGRKPVHTLTPMFAAFDDGRQLGFGTMGGEGQPQSLGAIFARYAFHKVPLAEAIDRPRWILGKTWGSRITNLRLESRFAAEVPERLMKAGHDVQVLPDAYTEVMGHAGGVLFDGRRVEGAHDPRSDGGAAAI